MSKFYYECQESAFAPGIADGWPEVIPAPHTPHGRLVRRYVPEAPATPAPACEPEDNPVTTYPKAYWYECQESAMAPGISEGWPKIIPAPHTPHGRLVRRERPENTTTPAHPTAPQVAQAAEVYAGMQRERRELWCLCAGQCIGRQLNGHEWSVSNGGFAKSVYDNACREAGKFADGILAEFDKRFGKGGA